MRHARRAWFNIDSFLEFCGESASPLTTLSHYSLLHRPDVIQKNFCQAEIENRAFFRLAEAAADQLIFIE
jgi:hypothetical protein